MTTLLRDGREPTLLREFLVPPALRPGDRVRVIAPASPFDRTLFFRGVGFLAERYRVEIGEGTLARSGFLAGSDETRRAALNAALLAPDVAAIIAARGGYGAVRIAHQVAFAALRSHPKWLVGFSDVTSLHVEAQRRQICSLHADNAAGLGRGDANARQAFIDALESPTRYREFTGLECWHPGNARGALVGGNLTVLFTAHAAGRLRLSDGCVLALEDVTEASYRIDRMLTALLVAGVLDRVSAVVVGDFTDCPTGPHGVPVEAVLRERLGVLRVPILAGLRFGHGAQNVPLHFGLSANVEAGAARLGIGGPPGP